MKKPYIILLAFFLLFGFGLDAQKNEAQHSITTDREPCSAKIKPENIDYHLRMEREFSQFYETFLKEGSRAVPVTIPIQLHIVTRSDGTGGAALAGILGELALVTAHYSVIDVSFQQCSAENYINSDTYYSLSGGAEGDALSAANNVANVLNIYFVGDANGFCGWARFTSDLPVDYIVIDNACATNTSTLAHEIGHYLDLLHTHSTSAGAELVDGTNCAVAGDLLCDTPADPRLNRDGGLVNAACMYTGGAAYTDANGDQYVPDPTNMMSYSLKYCRTFFSPEQQARMLFTIANGRSYLDFGCVSNCVVDVTCPQNVDIDCSALTPINAFAGSLTRLDPIWNRPSGDVGCAPSGVGTSVYYDYQIFIITHPDTYTFTMSAPFDGVAALYETCFNPAVPCGNIVEYDDDGGGFPNPLIMTAIINTPGTYTLVTTTYDNGELGNYSWTISSAAGESVYDGNFGAPPLVSGCPGEFLKFCDTYGNTLCNNAFEITRQWILSDGQNTDNCFQTINVTDNTPPMIVCPPNVVINCEDPTSPAFTGMATATDNCSDNLVPTFNDFSTQGNNPTLCSFYEYTIIRTWSVMDECGNPASCPQTITVVDNEAPAIICPMDQTVECATDIIVDVTSPDASDNCFVVVTAEGPNLVSGQADCDGAIYEVIYTANDACGNTAAVCTQTWTLSNNKPILVCDPGFPVECVEDIVVADTDVDVTTACNVGFMVDIYGPYTTGGPVNCPGSMVRYQYVVTDDCGRISICNRFFTIENDPPTIVCVPGQIVECAADIIADASQVTITTSCDLESTLTIDDPIINGLPDCPGTTYLINYTVMDPCGRTDDCSQTWTIQNDDPMIIECAPDRIVECSSDIMAEPELVEFTVSCDMGYTLTPGPIVPLDDLGDCPGATYQITYTLEDACFRITSCTQTFVVDNRPPRVFPDEDKLISCLEDATPRWEDCFVETDCDLGIVRYEIIGPIHDEDVPMCTNGKIINYLYSVWDACGRMTCVAQAWTIDNDGIVIDNPPADITLDCLDAIPTGLDVTASYDGCGSAAVSINDVEVPLAGNDYVIERTFSATDDCGNSDSHLQRITVICTSPQARTYCTQSERFWGNRNMVNENGEYSRFVLRDLDLLSNPLVLGLPGRSMTFNNGALVLRALPTLGPIEALPPTIGDYIVGISEGLPTDYFYRGRLKNRLIGQVLTLMLNERINSEFVNLELSEICIDFPQEVLNQLPGTPTVGDLIDLGNQGLGGIYEASLIELRSAIKAVNDYFRGCSAPACEGSESQAFTGSGSSGKNVENSFLQINPNPTDAELMLDFKMDGEKILIRIYNAMGQLMLSESTVGGQFIQRENMNINDWPRGTYFVSITNGEELLTEKLIKL